MPQCMRQSTRNSACESLIKNNKFLPTFTKKWKFYRFFLALSVFLSFLISAPLVPFERVCITATHKDRFISVSLSWRIKIVFFRDSFFPVRSPARRNKNVYMHNIFHFPWRSQASDNRDKKARKMWRHTKSNERWSKRGKKLYARRPYTHTDTLQRRVLINFYPNVNIITLSNQ